MCPKYHLHLRSFTKTDCSSLATLSQFIDRVVDTAAANEAASDRTATALTFVRPCWAQRLAPEVVPSEGRAGTAGKTVNSTHRILGYC